MEMFYFISALLFNVETFEVDTKYQQLIYFYTKENCENFLFENQQSLRNGLQLYLDYQQDKSEIYEMKCEGLTRDQLKDLGIELDEGEMIQT
tara:strand:+ start:556 stop:831 length:276 start_codon:yes stop_codon:yes gene_type:complete